MNKKSEPYVSGDYNELYESAESISMAEVEIVPYSQSLARKREMEAALDYYYELGRKEGYLEGLAEARAEGRAEGRLHVKEETARKMKAAGVAVELISQFTELPSEKIAEL